MYRCKCDCKRFSNTSNPAFEDSMLTLWNKEDRQTSLIRLLTQESFLIAWLSRRFTMPQKILVGIFVRPFQWKVFAILESFLGELQNRKIMPEDQCMALGYSMVLFLHGPLFPWGWPIMLMPVWGPQQSPTPWYASSLFGSLKLISTSIHPSIHTVTHSSYTINIRAINNFGWEIFCVQPHGPQHAYFITFLPNVL